MKEFFVSLFYKYTNFISIDWLNLQSSLWHNFLVILACIIVGIAFIYIIGILDDLNSPWGYFIGKIIIIPIVVLISILILFLVISVFIFLIVIGLLIVFSLIKFMLWIFSAIF